MAQKKPSGPPMYLDNMRHNGIRGLLVSCRSCRVDRVVNMDAYDGFSRVGQRLARNDRVDAQVTAARLGPDHGIEGKRMPTTLERVAGLRLRDIRERRGVTQRELAFALHATPSLITHWEKGRTPLSVARIDQLARVLHVKPAALRMMPGEPLRR